MGKLYYVVDEGPTRHYPTLEEAREDAENQISYLRSMCDPEWSSSVETIAVYQCVTETDEPEEDGQCVLKSTMINIREPDEGEDPSVDFYCDYAMRDPRP